MLLYVLAVVEHHVHQHAVQLASVMHRSTFDSVRPCCRSVPEATATAIYTMLLYGVSEPPGARKAFGPPNAVEPPPGTH